MYGGSCLLGCSQAPGLFKSCSPLQGPPCLLSIVSLSALCFSGCPCPAHIPSCSHCTLRLPSSLIPLGQPLVTFLQPSSNGRHFRRARRASEGLLGRPFRPFQAQGEWVPISQSPLTGAGVPSRCCREVAWSPQPSLRGGPRRTPSPPASSSRSRNVPRRQRSRRTLRVRLATGVMRTERSRRCGLRTQPARNREPADHVRVHAVCFLNVLLP